MSHLNYEFFDEFKALDNLCRDIYGRSAENKLGVTLYLEDMDKKAYQGSFKIAGWWSDYNRLKLVRNIRNEMAHSCNSMTIDICSQENIDFVCSFKARILKQTDPLALLRRQANQPHPSTTKQVQPTHTLTTTKKLVAGIGFIAVFLIIIACIIAFFL